MNVQVYGSSASEIGPFTNPNTILHTVDFNGFNAVDIGLVVNGYKVLFCDVNIGARTQTEIGNYYAWGEISCDRRMAYGENTYAFYDYGGTTYWKYTSHDNRNELCLDDDVAHVVMKGDWMLPTEYEMRQLLNSSTITKTFTSINGVYGLQVSGNGNSIFLPNTGYFYDDLLLESYAGFYLTKTLYNQDFAMGLMFNQGDDTFDVVQLERFCGYAARAVIHVPIDIFNNHDYVNLNVTWNGKRLLFATKNVGANTETDYGNYYAWGEHSTKSNYSWSTYAYNPSGDGSTFVKYKTTDGKTELDIRDNATICDDTVHALWGGAWRMPTAEEWQALLDQTTNQWVTNYNGSGKNGRLFTGTNGNTMFIPAAGGWSGSSLYDAGSDANVWSSSLGSSNVASARLLFFNSSAISMYHSSLRYFGFSARGVVVL